MASNVGNDNIRLRRIQWQKRVRSLSASTHRKRRAIIELELADRPDVAPMGRVGRPVRLPAKHQSEPGLPDPRIPEQDHLGVAVPPRGPYRPRYFH